VADLTAAHAPRVEQAYRGIALLARQQVLVQDEVRAPRPVELVWHFHTQAKVDINGGRATLAQGKAKLLARILAPEGAQFEVISANPPPPQRQQPDVRDLVIRLPDPTPSTRIAVLLAPVGEDAVPVLEPLERWIALGQLK
jgi:hypothetical protein